MTLDKEPDVATRSIIDILQQIDDEVTPSLQQDLEQIKNSSKQTFRKRKPYISFTLGPNEFAIDIDAVQEIGELPAITRLPNLPHWILGITQIRGEVLSAVNFSLLFDLPTVQQYKTKKSYIIFIYQDFKCCFVVDRITGVVRIDNNDESFEHISFDANSPMHNITDLLQGIIHSEQRIIHFLQSEKVALSPRLRQWR